MLAKATTIVDILRDSDTEDTDGYGDETETPEAVLPEDRSGVPASIIEQTRRVPDATSGNLVTAVFTVGRVGPGVDVREGDRLRDSLDGRIYAVTEVHQPQSPVRKQDKRLELSHV